MKHISLLHQKPSHNGSSALWIECPSFINVSSSEERVPGPRSLLASTRALDIPEIILLVLEQLDHPSLLSSLQVTSLWYQTGQHLVWQTLDWDNTISTSFIEDKMVKNIRRMRTLRCMFHSQTGTSYIDSSILLRTLLMGSGDGLDSKTDEFKTNMLKVLSLRGHFNLQTIGQRSVIGSTGGGDVVTTPNYIPFCIPTLVHLDIRPSVNSAIDLHLILDTAIGLRTLVIDSHGSFVDSNSNYAVNTLQSQSFPSANSLMTLTTSVVGLEHASEAKISHRQAHKSLVSLKIHHLKMSRQDLEGIAARCPNLTEFQSFCSPATLWRTQHGSHQQYQHQLQQLQPRSLVHTLAISCPKITRFHIGLQQGGFHIDLVRDALTSFPRLVSLGLPATDCTKATMEVIKSYQSQNFSSVQAISSSDGTGKFSIGTVMATTRLNSSKMTNMFLTSLTIMNVSSSERTSQAIHEFLCWTPYLKEFYAYNTTLYLEQMQHSSTSEEKGYDIAETRNPSSSTQPINILPLELQRDCGRDGGNRSEQSDVRGSLPELSHNDSGIEGEESESTGCVRGGVTVHPSYEADIHDISSVTLSLALPPASLASSTPVATSDFSSKRRQQQWACTKLETLAVRFAHLPWRNGTEPPKRSKETFAFLAGLQKLKRLYIKEGLMLESGREYDALGGLRGLEEVVFTTCYPIPIKPTDMEWIAVAATSPSSSNSISLALKKIVVQRQKSNAALDKEMIRWFNEHGAGVQLSLQLIDCCEEEDRFS